MKMKGKILMTSLIGLALFMILMLPLTSGITGSIGNARMILRADVGDVVEKYIKVINVNDMSVDITLTSSGDLADYIVIQDDEFTLDPGEEMDAYFTIEIAEEGTTESQIDVEFVPSNGGDSVSLSSTIIVITPSDTTPPEIEIFLPINNYVHKGDFTGLYALTDEPAVCEYSLNDSGFEEMSYTNDDEHYQLITGLQDTTESDAYNIEVRCTDEYGNSNSASVSFDVDLSKVRELFILEDIGDYKYSRSTAFDFWEEDEGTGMYFSYYEKDSEENTLYSVVIFEMDDELSLWEEFLEEIPEEVSIETINGQNIYIYDDGYEKFLVWHHENLMIFVMKFSNVEDDIDEMIFMGFFGEPDYMDSIPLALVEAYLEKYPSDVEPEPDKILLTDCGILNVEGAVYELQNDITTSDTCFVIEADNITLDLNEYSITGDGSGKGIYIEENNKNTAIKNGRIYNLDFGIYLMINQNINISNITGENNRVGILFLETNNSELSQSHFENNRQHGIRLSDSNNNIVNNNQAKNNMHGISLFGGFGNTITENLIENNTFGILFDRGGSSNTIHTNRILNNSETIEFNQNDGLIENNLFYNNLIISTRRYIDFNAINGGESNQWSIPKQAGENIIGGSYIGGNFWGTPDESGFSETCENLDGDGICDFQYELGEGNIDSFPLSPGYLSVDPSFSLEIIQDLKLNPDENAYGGIYKGVYENIYEGIIKITNTGDVNFLYLRSPTGHTGNCNDYQRFCGIQFDGPFDWYPNGICSLEPGESQEVKVVLEGSPSDYGRGDISLDMGVVAYYYNGYVKQIEDTVTLTLEKSFCEYGKIGQDLEITKVTTDNKGRGKDDKWKPYDEIEIKVEVENKGSEDLDVIVELGLLDEDSNNIINDFEFEDGDEKIEEKIKDNNNEEVTFEFRVPADVEEGNYKLVVKVYDKDLGELNLCYDYSEEIEVEREDDEGKFIVFDNIKLDLEEVSCGESVTITADVINIGDENQKLVKVNLINDELGLSLSKEIRNLDEGDRKEVSFTFEVPEVEAGEYKLELSTDYDHDDGEYKESSDDKEVVSLRVLECGLSGGEVIDEGDEVETLTTTSAVDSSKESSRGYFAFVKDINGTPFLWIIGIAVVIVAILIVIVVLVRIWS